MALTGGSSLLSHYLIFDLVYLLNYIDFVLFDLAGTPYYMSPEIFANKRYDVKSDMWAVGCILHELATFQPPFNAQDITGLARKVHAPAVYVYVHGHLPRSASLPPVLVIRTLLVACIAPVSLIVFSFNDGSLSLLRGQVQYNAAPRLPSHYSKDLRNLISRLLGASDWERAPAFS